MSDDLKAYLKQAAEANRLDVIISDIQFFT